MAYPKGKSHSEETKARMRAAHAGRPGRPQTEAAKEKLRQARLAVVAAKPKRPPKPRRPNGWKLTAQQRQCISERRKGSRLSDEARQRRSEKLKAFWAALTPAEREERLRRWHGQPHYSDTSIERSVRAVLDDLGIVFEAQKALGPYWCDFYLPEFRLVVECDGDYWHSKPEQQEYDRRRDGWMQRHGYHVSRILGSAIIADARTSVLTAIGGYIGDSTRRELEYARTHGKVVRFLEPAV